MRPTRQGIAVAISGAVMLALGRLFVTEFYALGSALLALVIACCLWVAFRSIDLGIRRTVRPARVHVGNPCTVEITVRNRRSRRSPVLRIHDPVTGTSGADLLLAPIRPKAASEVAYRLPTTARGLVTVGPMRVHVADPFGLASARTAGAGAVEITVLPRVDDIPPLPRTTGPDPDGGAETGSLGRLGEDFAALRPYAIGDDLRRVHWPSSARTDDDLLVRQDDVPWQGRVSIVLDIRRDAHDADTLERAVSAAASIAKTHVKRGDHVRLVSTTGRDTDFGVGASHLDRMLEYLAIVERTSRGSLHGALDLVQRGGSGALVVVSGRPAPTDLDVIDAIGGAITTRRVVRFDRSDRLPTTRRTLVVGVGPGDDFADTWRTSVAAGGRLDRAARRTRRPMRSGA